MYFHQSSFAIRQPTWLKQNGVGNSDLAYVVELRCEFEDFYVRSWNSRFARYQRGVTTNSNDVLTGIIIPVRRRSCETMQQFEPGCTQGISSMPYGFLESLSMIT
jgi:hypothetical protein